MKAIVVLLIVSLAACAAEDSQPEQAELQLTERIESIGAGSDAEPGYVMDPEPDHYKDRKSCDDWCNWSRRQCEKWCWHEHPEPFGDWYKRLVCFRDRCEKDPNPDIGQKACEADCQRRFPERP